MIAARVIGAPWACLQQRQARWRLRALVTSACVLAGLLFAGVSPRPAAAAGPDAIRTHAGCLVNTLARNDDGSTGRVTLPFAIRFFGQTYTSLFVNNNGNVTFSGPLGDYTPYPLGTAGQAMIAPFFADVDTRHPESDVVTYGVATVEGREAFCVNWSGVAGVGYYSAHVDKLNKFQLLLIDRSDVDAADFDIELNFDQIQWETGDASGGSGGQGGVSARMGYTGGTESTAYEDPRSGVDGAFLDSNAQGLIHRSRGTPQLGRYLFSVRDGTVDDEALPKLVFLAGIGGNEIRKSDCMILCAVWPQVLAAARYGSDLEVEADGETPRRPTEGGEVFGSVFGSPVYQEALHEFRSWACEFVPCTRLLRDFDTFTYDWRIGVRREGLRLADLLAAQCNEGPVWLVAHSTGGLVVKRAFRELRHRGVAPLGCLDGGGVFFLATPHLGAPKAVGALVMARNFFWGNASIAGDSLDSVTRVTNNWLTPWELMPRADIDEQLEAFPWYLRPPETKRPREPWFAAGRSNDVGEPLNFALDAKAAARVDEHLPLAETIGNVPYYDVFAYRRVTQGSYAPQTCTKDGGRVTFAPSATEARVDGVIWGDGTVPTWSASWPGQLVDSKHLYGIPNVVHGMVPNNPAVLELIRRVIASDNAELYPDWAHPHGAEAIEQARPSSRPQFVRGEWCSPVAGRAELDGQITGVADSGETREDIPGSLVDVAGPASDPHTSVFVPVEPPLQLPAFTTRATGSGPVAFVFTDLEEAEHAFMFDVSPGDTSRFALENGTWRLTVDRGGDGSSEQSVELGAPSVDFLVPEPLHKRQAITLTARQRGETEVGGSYAWAISGDAASLVQNGDSATLAGVRSPGSVTVTLTFTTATGATATFSRAIDVLPPVYAPAGADCLGQPGRTVLQPVNADGSSVFKAGRTVPVKFRVCDAAGNPVGPPPVVTGFALTRREAGTVVEEVNETPVSTTPDSGFRWDPSAEQWIVNLSTDGLAPATTYTYSITLDEGSVIPFTFGLR